MDSPAQQEVQWREKGQRSMTRKPRPQTELARRLETRISIAPGLIEGWLEGSERFRTMCEEYDEHLRAFDQWRATAQMHHGRTKEVPPSTAMALRS